jgi:Pyrimidine dimer DNA glycosylase
MVNTFLPYADFKETAKLLDYRRLGKQRVEAWQILRANLGVTDGWRNHPAATMWRGHEGALAQYTIVICDEWISRGYKDNLKPKVLELVDAFNLTSEQKPWWIGIEEFHVSHQSNLKRKDSSYYTFDITDDLPYKWPMPDNSFRIIEQKVKR